MNKIANHSRTVGLPLESSFIFYLLTCYPFSGNQRRWSSKTNDVDEANMNEVAKRKTSIWLTSVIDHVLLCIVIGSGSGRDFPVSNRGHSNREKAFNN